MKSKMFAAQLLLVASFFFADCFGYSSSNSAGLAGIQRCSALSLPQRHGLFVAKQQHQMQQNGRRKAFLLQQAVSNDGIASEAITPRKIPPLVYKLNASTKWLVTLACILGVWTRIHHYEGPFVIIGSILSSYFTMALKKVLNQGRPDGAPFTDPGMPSSHSLVSFFLAAAWSTLVLPSSPLASGLLLTSAAIIALLRVICGYHSWAQIIVGTVLGCGMGLSWAKLGSFVAKHGHPTAVFRTSWIVYLFGSAFYTAKTIRPWLNKEKHL